MSARGSTSGAAPLAPRGVVATAAWSSSNRKMMQLKAVHRRCRRTFPVVEQERRRQSVLLPAAKSLCSTTSSCSACEPITKNRTQSAYVPSVSAPSPQPLGVCSFLVPEKQKRFMSSAMRDAVLRACLPVLGRDSERRLGRWLRRRLQGTERKKLRRAESMHAATQHLSWSLPPPAAQRIARRVRTRAAQSIVRVVPSPPWVAQFLTVESSCSSCAS